MVFTEPFYVGYSDINKELGLSNTSILRYFENAASLHGSAVGNGLGSSPVRWFLTAYHVKVHKRPRHEERVRVETWSREMRGVTASREFALYDQDGNLAVTALSNWGHINIETGKPERIPADYNERYGSEPDRSLFGALRLGKLKECESYLHQQTFTIPRYFIDANHHMNNVNYLDLASLVLPQAVYDLPEACEFEIAYKQAITEGETVLCLYGETEDSHYVTIKSQDGSETKAVIRLYK
jgi:acyl-ACP thioesterase